MTLLKEIIRDCGLKKPSLDSTLLALLVGLAFGGAGLFLFIDQFLKPYQGFHESSDWVEVEATILKSHLIRDGETSEIDILYRYTFESKTYENNRVGLSNVNNLGDDENLKFVAELPKNKTSVAYVNPHDPNQSMINHEMGIENWLALFGSIPFLTVGSCAIIFSLFNGMAFRIQKAAWKEVALIASRHAAFEMNKFLLNENLKAQDRIDINFLKREKLLTSFACILVVLFVGGIITCMIISTVILHFRGDSLAYLFAFFIIPIFFFGPYFIKTFFTYIFASKGDDYVIISEWDYEYTQVTHHWLRLSDPQDASEISIFTCATESSKELKKILRSIPFADVFKVPDKSVITGTIVHPITGSSQKEINLLIQTKSKSKKKYNQHQLNLYTPDSS